MSFVTAALRLFLLLVFFLFAIRNDEPATLRFYFDLEWRAPLILMLLLFFFAGVLLTLVALLPRLASRRGAGGATPPAPAARRDAAS